MAEKTCANHKGVPAVGSCAQCRKDLCKSCVMVTPNGTFCSSECSVLFREMKAQAGGGAKKGSGAGLKLLLVVVLFAAAAAIAVHYLSPGSPYDVIGKFLR